MVVVTHHLAEVWDVATRVAVMVAGRWALRRAGRGPLAAFTPRYQAMVGA